MDLSNIKKHPTYLLSMIWHSVTLLLSDTFPSTYDFNAQIKNARQLDIRQKAFYSNNDAGLTKLIF